MSLCVQGHWCERAVRAALPPGERGSNLEEQGP